MSSWRSLDPNPGPLVRGTDPGSGSVPKCHGSATLLTTVCSFFKGTGRGREDDGGGARAGGTERGGRGEPGGATERRGSNWAEPGADTIPN